MAWTELDLATQIAANEDLQRRNPHLGLKSPRTVPIPESATIVRPEPVTTPSASKTERQRLQQLAAGMSEAQLQSNVRRMATVCGWKIYHTRDSRKSDIGFPDLVLVRKNRLLFVELKSEKGKITPEQREWLHVLMLTKRVETFLWRPSQWLDGTIEGMLR